MSETLNGKAGGEFAGATGSAKRGIVCAFCGEAWGYDGEQPTEEMLKAAVEHEAQCPKNPYRNLVQRLYALVVEHHECKIMREEHCVCPLCSQEQNKKTLEEAWNVFYSPNDQAQAQPPTVTPERKGDNQ